MLWGYGGEGFYFDRPAFWQTLFGFRKGLFIYSPLLLLAFACLLPRSPAMIFAKFSFVGFFCLLIYFVSTWWIWYYGPGFGQRVVVDFLPVFAIAMAFGLRAIFVKSAEQSAGHTPYVKAGRVALVALMVALLALNLVQSYQYHVGIISAWDMDSTKYRYTFLKVGDEYRNVLGGNQDMMPYHQEKKVVFLCMADFESPESSFETSDFWQLPGRQNRVSDYRGKEFNTVLRIAIDTSYITGKNLHLSVAFDKYEMEPGQLHEDALFVLALESNKGEQYSHYTFNINEIPIFETGRWESKRYEVEVPIRKAGDVISVYIWNKPKKQLLIDNWEVRLYALR